MVTWAKLRLARREDAGLYWEWANDPTVRASAFQSALIPWETHLPWFEPRLGMTPTVLLFVLEAHDGRPLGQVRLEREGSRVTVDVSVAPRWRGVGCGTQLITEGLAQARTVWTGMMFVADILDTNTPSIRLFTRCGFVEAGRGARPGKPSVVLERQ